MIGTINERIIRAGLAALCTLPVGFAQTSSQTWPTPPSTANVGVSSSATTGTQADIEGYWTPSRLMNAKPINLVPKVGANGLPDAPQAEPNNSPSVREEGALPRSVSQPATTLIPEVFLRQEAEANAAAPASGIETQGTSSFGAHFTTYRVFPDAATTTYPNRTAGKLFFRDPRTGEDFKCSASTLQRRLVVTAGHCVTNASTDPGLRYFYSNFLFVPAYRNGIAPLGVWTPSIVWVTNTWFFSNGSVPNAQDVGMLVMNDRSGVPIGNVTGWLGWWTNRLSRNHVTMLGYPKNLDSGERMQINHAFTYIYGGNNTYIYGSAMRGGSSGGPWIQDYGVPPTSNPFISFLGTNYLVSVTSYGPIAFEPKYQGGSNLDSRFISLKNAACGAFGSGNCI
jgi:V8-like Glu-specific endopeptidase